MFFLPALGDFGVRPGLSASSSVKTTLMLLVPTTPKSMYEIAEDPGESAILGRKFSSGSHLVLTGKN